MAELYKTSLDLKNCVKIEGFVMTNNQNYGFYVPENSIEKKWFKVKRFGKKNSPMTKFVDDMALTNREFSLF